VLFVIPSILVSIAVTPILLSISPTPAFDTTKPMSLRELFQVSPLGCTGMFLLGGVFAAQFGMSAVYGTAADLSVAQISTFVSTFFIGAIITQYPIGWLSDRMDRRQLIVIASAVGAGACVIGGLFGAEFWLLLAAAFLMGGMANPLYSLLIAHTNDYLEPEDMAAASGGMIFINGLGAIAGPVITGWAMDVVGPAGFFIFAGSLFAALTVYGLYRSTRRPAPSVEDTGSYVAVTPTASPVAVDAAIEYAQEYAQTDDQ
jgi:MFS family permease